MLVASAACAQEAEDDWYFLTDVFAPEDCSPRTARLIPFAEAISAPLEAGTFDCVTVEGLWVGNTLYEGVEGFYADIPRARSSVRLGVYGWLERIESPRRPTPARLTGRIGECAGLGGPGVLMVMGYCHYVSGRFIALGEGAIEAAVPERLTGAASRGRLGRLLEIDPASALHATAAARAREWLSLLRAGDAEAYARTYGREYQLAAIDDPGSDFHALFRDERSLFHRLKNNPDQPQLRLWRRIDEPLDPDDERRDPSDYSVLACFKVGVWNGDRWPVAGIDADNDNDRPYACIDVWRYSFDGQAEDGLDAEVGFPGLAEPRGWPD